MKIEIVAECGKNQIDSTNYNHTVDDALLKAKRLVHYAKLSGAGVIKWQCHVLEDEKKKRDKSRWGWIKMNEDLTPSEEFWKPLKEWHDWQGVEMLITPMSRTAAQKVNELVDRWKVSSADITDMKLLKYLKNTGKPIILSTGMSMVEQVDKAVKFLGDQIQYLCYCVSLYPCDIWKVDLAKLVWMNEKYDMSLGFSDHSLSVEVPALAVRIGARYIEKHFCLSRDNYGPDFKVSLEPTEFKQMAELCKKAETEGESFEEERTYWKNFRANEVPN